jgi:hypothetical protein
MLKEGFRPLSSTVVHGACQAQLWHRNHTTAAPSFHCPFSMLTVGGTAQEITTSFAAVTNEPLPAAPQAAAWQTCNISQEVHA